MNQASDEVVFPPSLSDLRREKGGTGDKRGRLYRGLLVFLGFCLVVFLLDFIYNHQIPEYCCLDSDWQRGLVYSPAGIRYSASSVNMQGKWNILLDQHSHTIYSGGSLTPEQNILWHLAQGYNAMALTDHYTFRGVDEILAIAREKYAGQIIILPGVEWTTRRVHLNLIFPPEACAQSAAISAGSCAALRDAIPVPCFFPSDQQIQEIIQVTHSLGGIVTANHILWAEETLEGSRPTRKQLLDWGVDYLEIVNEEKFDQESLDFAIRRGMGIISGSDVHSPIHTYAWTVLSVNEFTAEAVFSELKARRTEVIYNKDGSPGAGFAPGSQAWYGLVHPLIDAGVYIAEIGDDGSWLHLAVWMAGGMALWALCELVGWALAKGYAHSRRRIGRIE